MAQELATRSFSAALFHIVFITIISIGAYFYTTDFGIKNLCLSGLIVFFSICRIYLSKNFNEKTNVKNWKIKHTVVVFTLGVSWGVFNFVGSHNTGTLSIVSISYFIVTLGLLSASLFSLAPSKRDFVLFSFALIVEVFIFVMAQDKPMMEFPLLFGTVFLFFFSLTQRDLLMKEWMKNFSAKIQIEVMINNYPGLFVMVKKHSIINANSWALDKLTLEKSKLNIKYLPENIVESINQFKDSKETLSLTVNLPLMINEQLRLHMFHFQKIENLNDQILIAAIDIQNHEDAKKEIIEQRILLESSAKLASLGEMSAGVAHEVNNPLTVILGHIDVLMRMTKNNNVDLERFNKGLELMKKSTLRIKSIIHSMKKISRDSSNDQFVEAKLEDIINDTLPLYETDLKNNDIEFSISPYSSDLVVFGDPTRLSQVILNLIMNAKDAIENIEKRWINLEITEDSENIKIQVTDCGNGIPLNLRDKMLNPFFTTKEVGRGTGLGLSISRGIIESHKGKLYFDFNCPNTRVVIELPKNQAASLPAENSKVA